MLEKRLVHVVDDDDSVRRSLAFLLTSSGFKVESWSNGESFLKKADRTREGCILLDIYMPGFDGLQVQSRMAAEGFNFPVIVLTGHGDTGLAVQAMKANAVDFLEKPFDKENLLAAIDVAFGRLANSEARRNNSEWAQCELSKLTMREREVLDGLACGYPNKTIAYDLHISTRTVEAYRASVMDKLEVTFFADALRVAFAGGLGSEGSWRASHLVS